MMAVAMVYAVAIGLPLALGGLLLDRCAALTRRPRRFVWTGTIVVQVALVAAMFARPVATSPITGATAASVEAVPVDSSSTLGPVDVGASIWSGWREKITLPAAIAIQTVASWNVFVMWLWTGMSASTVMAFAVARWMLARRRRGWRHAMLNDSPVLVAPAEGPAVIGVLAPRIVVPEWAFALDDRSRDLMLRHEEQHLRARDPILLHLSGLAIVAMPWNPVIWWLFSRLRLAVELDCDARVLGRTAHKPSPVSSDAAAYGELLFTVVSHRSSRRSMTAVAMLEAPSTLSRRIAAMYPNTLRWIGLRAIATGAAAIGIIAAVLVSPTPTVSAQQKATKDAAAKPSLRLAGPVSAPAFRAPSIEATKALVAKHSLDAANALQTHGIVFIQNESGQILGMTTVQVVEMVMAEAKAKPAEDTHLTETQARERHASEQQAHAASNHTAAVRGVEVHKHEGQHQGMTEAEARAANEEAARLAKDLAGRLLSIDVVDYADGELAPHAMRVFFITTKGGSPLKK